MIQASGPREWVSLFSRVGSYSAPRNEHPHLVSAPTRMLACIRSALTSAPRCVSARYGQTLSFPRNPARACTYSSGGRFASHPASTYTNPDTEPMGVVPRLAVSTKSNKKQMHNTSLISLYTCMHHPGTPVLTGIGEAPANPKPWVSHRQKSCFFWMMMA